MSREKKHVRTMHLCLRCPNINKRILYSRKDEWRKARTGIQRRQFLCVFMHVHTHICLLTTPKEKAKVAMCGEEAGRTKKERKMCFLSSYHGRKTSQNVREQQLLYYATLRGDDDTTSTHTHFLTPANRLMHHSHKG